MNSLLQQRFFRLMSEYSQRKVSVLEFTEAIEELAAHLADFSITKNIIAFYYVIYPLVYTVLNRIVYDLSKEKILFLL